MGLGPTGAMGSETEICIVEQETSNDKWWFKFGVMLLVFILVAFAVGCFVVRRHVKRLLDNEADPMIGEHMREVPALRLEVNGLRMQLDDVSQRVAVLTQQMIERGENMETLSDRQDGLHYVLVELGGYVRSNDITAAQRRHMYKQERGNMMAMQTMGSNQYLRTVRAQSRGFVRGGEDTDVAAGPATSPTVPEEDVEVEDGEESPADLDEIMEDTKLNPEGDFSTRRGELTSTVDELRNQLQEALVSESWRDAAEIQQTILLLLDRLNTNDLRDPAARREMYERLAERMERLPRRVRSSNNTALADQYMAYAMSYKNQMG
eukprot:s1257_g32.t1